MDTATKGSEVERFCLVYVSKIVGCLTLSEINHIVEGSCTFNKQHGITGFLIHARDTFVQYLEGTSAALRACFSRIEKDPHHTEVTVLAFHQLEQRQFQHWDMRYFSGDTHSTYGLREMLARRNMSDEALVREVTRIARLADPLLSAPVHDPLTNDVQAL